jgi:hypothetical protein
MTITTLSTVSIADDGSTVGSNVWNDLVSCVRFRLTSDQTFYVRTDGSDSNNGQTDSAAGAFLTLTGAANYISKRVEPNGFRITVKIGAGSYAGLEFAGSSPAGDRDDDVVYFRAGDGLTASDVHITSASYLSRVNVQFNDIDFQHQVWCEPYTRLYPVNTTWTVFGNLYLTPFVFVQFNGVTTIGTDASMFRFVYFDGAPSELIWDGSIVLTGTPAWAVAFMDIGGSGNFVQWAVTTLTGSATGVQAIVKWNASLEAVDGGDLTEIPGTAASIDYGQFRVNTTTTTGVILEFPSPNNDTTIQHYANSANDDLLISGSDLFFGGAGAGLLQASNISIADADNVALRTRADAFMFPQIQYHADATNGTQSNANMVLYRWSADSTGATLAFAKSRSNSIGTNTVVSAGDVLGEILWNGSDGTDNEAAAGIRAIVDGTPGGNDMPGAVVIAVTSDGSTTCTDRFSVRADGGILFGSSSSATLTSGGAGTATALSFMRTVPSSVDGLPTASTANMGARHFVNDATTNTFAATAVGGSTYAVPVYSDGAAWKIGG